jgi:hypothetical protein
MLELVTNTLTFPGAVVHEWAHAAAARSRGLRVHEVVLFRPLSNPVGFVRHERAHRPADALAVALAPCAVNASLALITAFLFAPALSVAWEAAALLLWLSWSLALHAPPSFDDMAGVDRLARGRLARAALTLVLTPLRALKAGEIVGTGYLFATAVVSLGVLASLAWFQNLEAALAVVEWFEAFARGLASVW